MYYKRFKKWFGFVMAIVFTILSGNVYAMAASAPLADTPDSPALANRVEDIPGGGKGVPDAENHPGGQWHADSRDLAENQMHNATYYRDQIDTTICEMKLESCPIDQILRSEKRTRKSISMIIKYYRIGQRPITTTLKTAVSATSNGYGNAIEPMNAKCFDAMDTVIFPKVQGYLADGVTRDPNHPLMVYVVGRTDAGLPIVIAVNGKKTSDNCYDLPDIAAGTVMLRLGRAAGERDVETGSYYTMPEPSEQYCQRFIMQVEQSKIEQLMKTEVNWDFIKQERTAMDDMRNGIERSGLFGNKGVTSWSNHGQIYFTGGIFYEAGKDLELGHWAKKIDEAGNAIQVPVQDKDGSGHLLYNASVTSGSPATTATVVVYQDGTAWKDSGGNSVTPDTGTTPTPKTTNQYLYEYIITQKELVRFINDVIQDAGNGSRTKLFFVDNLIYQALANLKASNRLIEFREEKDYQNWHLDFESFSSMGTKILIYRHDAFNYMKMDGMGFCLDPRYLEKWMFEDWDRQDYDLKNLFIRNSNAVVMTEYSGWTLQFPNAHARVSRPEFDSSLGVTDELQAA